MRCSVKLDPSVQNKDLAWVKVAKCFNDSATTAAPSYIFIFSSNKVHIQRSHLMLYYKTFYDRK
jgi:hypothetical protein